MWGALSAGFTQASTIVSRGRLLQRGNLSYDHVDPPKRSPFHGGSVLALSWLPGGKLYAIVRGTYWHLYVTLDSARTWYPRPALGMPRSTRAIAAARTQGRPRRRLRGGRPRRPVALDRRGRELVAPARRGQRAVGGDDAGALAARRRRPARAGLVGRLRHRPGTAAGPRATIVAADPRNDRIWWAVAPDGELLVSTDGGQDLVSAPPL